MSEVLKVVSYGFGTILGLILIGIIVFWFIQDMTQKKHSILRNYPVIGRLRFLFERQREYFRQYFFSGDRDEMPFNRATRTWVYKNAKNEGGIVGFGSTNDLREPGSIIFVNVAFPVLERERLPTPSLTIGDAYCEHPCEIHNQHQWHELWRDLGTRGACAVARCGRGGMLAEYRGGRARALSSGGRMRHRYANRYRQVRYS